jgi:hypothetical protein
VGQFSDGIPGQFSDGIDNVPAPNDPNLYYFLVQGERIEQDTIRIWVTHTTALLLKQMLGDTSKDVVSAAILVASRDAVMAGKTKDERTAAQIDAAQPLLITVEAYEALTQAFDGVSDEHMIQRFLGVLSLG